MWKGFLSSVSNSVKLGPIIQSSDGQRWGQTLMSENILDVSEKKVWQKKVGCRREK